MGSYGLGSLFLDISIGLILVSVLVRAMMAFVYTRRNGEHDLTDAQKQRMRRVALPISILGLLFAIASLILLSVSLA